MLMLMLAAQTCGLMGWDNWCQYCKARDGLSQVHMPYGVKLLFQELMAMNILPRLKLEPV